MGKINFNLHICHFTCDVCIILLQPGYIWIHWLWTSSIPCNSSGIFQERTEDGQLGVGEYPFATRLRTVALK